MRRTYLAQRYTVRLLYGRGVQLVRGGVLCRYIRPSRLVGEVRLRGINSLHLIPLPSPPCCRLGTGDGLYCIVSCIVLYCIVLYCIVLYDSGINSIDKLEAETLEKERLRKRDREEISDIQYSHRFTARYLGILGTR